MAVVQTSGQQQCFVEKLPDFGNQRERAPGSGMTARTCCHGNQAIDAGFCCLFCMAPGRDVVEDQAAVHAYGGLVFHDVTTRRHAEKAAEAGVDGLIAVAAGAGGHAGTWSPFSLIAEIRQFFDKTLLLAGCLNHGHEILAAQLLGADLAYFGTRFIGTTESHAPDAYKQMLLTSRAADIVHTPAVWGVPASFMRQSLEAAGFDTAALQGKGEVNFGSKLKPISDEAKAWKTVWSAGQGVGGIDDLPTVDQLVARLDAEYRKALELAAQLPKRWPR